MFRGPRRNKGIRFVNISGGTGGPGGEGGLQGGGGGFRRIPLGDIVLQYEIQSDMRSGVVTLRRLHSAKICDKELVVTVAMYEGDGAVQEWRRDIQKYMTVRHPNIVQLYATASCGDTRAVVFHDDLIPLQQFLKLYQQSHFSTLYIHAYVVLAFDWYNTSLLLICLQDNEFRATCTYVRSIFQRRLLDEDCTFFIRYSTRTFCADLVPGGALLIDFSATHSEPMSTQQGLKLLVPENTEGTIIDTLTLDQYHEICYWKFSTVRCISISTSMTVNLPSVVNCAPGNKNIVEIAWLPDAEVLPSQWYIDRKLSISSEVMPNGWTRFNSDGVVDSVALLQLWSMGDLWLSQANHTFTSLQIVSNFQDYVVSNYIYFTLAILSTETAVPPGFLFLCPPEDFQVEQSFRWPDCAAYWSCDPSGAERLTLEDAIKLGFPSLQPSTKLWGKSWDASVYDRLRHFHQAKGFNPDSTHVAWYLGQDLFKLSFDRPGISFAHIDDEDSDYTSNENESSQHLSDELLHSTLVSTLTDHVDIPIISDHQDKEELSICDGDEHSQDPIEISNNALELTLTDRSVHQDMEEVPISGTFKLVMSVQLFLVAFLAVSWAQYELFSDSWNGWLYR
ncbi:hypothetical protein MSAN_00297600 [Mycena sanguinolenta]|uniref:Protein kinase domain-containing protein n=1 Tax=Mycena sanguinolenta TaxID=230812 RepID=A0A8H6ZAW9_9AGAR|nr:hypothetical protein MSAN_00297600 [Mycena sanguinolenta]